MITPAELEEYRRRTAPELSALGDPLWRIANLYSVLHKKTKRDVQFVPGPEQTEVLIAIFIRGWLRIIIPKARQLGMSTLLAIVACDGIFFRSGYHAALIDKTAEDAVKKHREKVMYVWERIPASIRARLTAEKATTDKLVIRDPNAPDEPESTFTAAINFRGGTVSMLWISEWGAIQDEDRARSKEIKAGAMPAIELADGGLCVIETTWKGGLDGELGPYVEEARGTLEADKGPKSWRILFFPWFTESIYSEEYGSVDPASAAYFRECEKRGVTLTEGQQKWYAKMRRTASSAKSMKEEYPTFVEECWENQPEGSIYGRWIEQARGEGRVSLWTPPKDYPVHTFWDIGMPINTATWLVQFTPYQVRVIDCLHEMDMTMEERAAWLRALGWDYGAHYFPWDADTDSASIGIIPINQYRRILGPSCRTLGRCKDVYDGIGIVRANFGRLVFCHNPATPADLTTPGGRMKRGMEYLARYREARESSTGITRNEPVHDRYSHIGSAFNQIGLAIVQGAVDHANHVGDARPKPERRSVPVIHAGARW